MKMDSNEIQTQKKRHKAAISNSRKPARGGLSVCFKEFKGLEAEYGAADG
ncbi:hypothetical protein ALQ89_00962, partial [Pseudomonas amygdali pv. tabaci]